MGMYVGLRFKGVVKEKFRTEFEEVALNGRWENAKDELIKSFAREERSSWIPCGMLCWMPAEWQEERNYDKESGLWIFSCSIKYGIMTIESFFELVPYFVEKIDYCETYYEEDEFSKKFELIDDKVVMVSDKYVQYRNMG